MERLTVNLTDRASASLARAADLTGDTQTDVVNRALSVYVRLEEIRAAGGAVYVRQGLDETFEQLVIF